MSRVKLLGVMATGLKSARARLTQAQVSRVRRRFDFIGIPEGTDVIALIADGTGLVETDGTWVGVFYLSAGTNAMGTMFGTFISGTVR
jgi:hypothetical protein